MQRSLLPALLKRALPVVLLQPIVLHAAMVSIDLPPMAMVDTPTVRLGQVARLTSHDLDLMRHLVALPLGSVAHRPEGTQLDRSSLARWIRSQTGLRDDQIEWSGEATTRIAIATTRLAPQMLIDTAQAALTQWLAQRAERFEVSPASELSALTIQGESARLIVRPIHHDRPHARMHVMLDVIGSSGQIRTVTVSFTVSAHVRGLVAGQDLASGSSPGSLLEEREIEVTSLHPHTQPLPVSRSGSTNQLRLRRGLHAGEIVKAKDLEPTPAVQRGDWIVLRLTNGDIAMEGRAEALQNGQLGQSVRVKLAGAERSILARVTGAGIAEVSK